MYCGQLLGHCGLPGCCYAVSRMKDFRILLCGFKVTWAVAGCYCVAKDFIIKDFLMLLCSL